MSNILTKIAFGFVLGLGFIGSAVGSENAATEVPDAALTEKAEAVKKALGTEENKLLIKIMGLKKELTDGYLVSLYEGDNNSVMSCNDPAKKDTTPLTTANQPAAELARANIGKVFQYTNKEGQKRNAYAYNVGTKLVVVGHNAA